MPLRHGRIDGKVDHELRAVTHLAGDFEVAAMLLDDLVRDGQTESGPLPLSTFGFGGIERIENMIEVPRLDSRPAVLHRYLYPGLVGLLDQSARANGEPPPLITAD